jgi:glycosyltransferase involved in cell wall biosynthesis
MHIAIDASRTTTDRVTGTEHYAREMIRHVIALNDARETPHHITLYFRNRPSPTLFPASPNVTHRVLPVPRLWTHTALALALAVARPDVTWVPAHTLPFFFPGKAVVTVHDLGYKVYPSAHPLRQRIPLEIYTRHSARRANTVLADSQATAADLHRYYRTPREKIRVVYPGVTPPLVGDVAAVRERYDLPKLYWLFVGTLQPRKNIAALVGAYHQWQAANPKVPAALVLAGGQGWKYDPRWVQGDGIILTGYIDESDKGALMAGALGLVFPSLYEGFGFPVLEAMSLGRPVVTSTTSSLPEVGGDAALLADPRNILMISDHMNIITEELARHETDRIERGREHAASFTWERAAEAALHALEACANS